MRLRGTLSFVRCLTCTHAGLAASPEAPCRLCGGGVRAEEPPPHLHEGWRCGCFQCRWGPC